MSSYQCKPPRRSCITGAVPSIDSSSATQGAERHDCNRGAFARCAAACWLGGVVMASQTTIQYVAECPAECNRQKRVYWNEYERNSRLSIGCQIERVMRPCKEPKTQCTWNQQRCRAAKQEAESDDGTPSNSVESADKQKTAHARVGVLLDPSYPTRHTNEIGKKNPDKSYDDACFLHEREPT